MKDQACFYMFVIVFLSFYTVTCSDRFVGAPVHLCAGERVSPGDQICDVVACGLHHLVEDLNCCY